MKQIRNWKIKASGTTLLEVLIAIVIFAVGMLALVEMQGSLARSSADASTRTVAANIAEEIVEAAKGFSQPFAMDNDRIDYEEIVSYDTPQILTRGGIDYTVQLTVTPYYYNPVTETFMDDTDDLPEGTPTVISDFKVLDLQISWGFEAQAGDPRGENLRVKDIVPSTPSLIGAIVAAEQTSFGGPQVDYTPGENPDIVAIQIDESKFKESTTPEPKVLRTDELVETWFDVITYATLGDDSIYLRREEFVSISCTCELQAASGEEYDGREPTLWNGVEYVEGAKVPKAYGIGATNQQSQYCDVCCQDHHDTGSGDESYRPKADDFDGDHKHYSRNNKGVLSEADLGDDYAEACRLVRKDGFFRVAQDFNLEAQSAFPEDYLDDVEEVKDYSDYVTAAVDAFYSNSPPTPIPDATSLGYPGSDDGTDPGDRTELPTGTGSESQQLRSRGLYADVLSAELQTNLANCFDNEGDPTPENQDCIIKNVASPLEVYPFFDVQLTKLARWTETEVGDPVEVTNEELETDNTHSRGVASLADSKVGLSTAHSNIDNGNTGLISIAPITEDLDYAPDYIMADLHIMAGDGTVTPPPTNVTVSGSLTNPVVTSNVPSVAGTGATCTRPDNETFSCVLDPLYTGTRILRVANYYTKNFTLRACSSQLTISNFQQGNSNSQNWTEFILPNTDSSSVVITIVSGTICP